MPHIKELRISAKELKSSHVLIDELLKAGYFEEYDVNTLQVVLCKKKAPVRINDVNQAIANLENYAAANSDLIETINGEQIILKKDLAKMMKISRPTLDKWINNGFIEKGKSTTFNMELYQIDSVLDQLRDYKK
jgi:hypothetical protein